MGEKRSVHSDEMAPGARSSDRSDDPLEVLRMAMGHSEEGGRRTGDAPGREKARDSKKTGSPPETGRARRRVWVVAAIIVLASVGLTGYLSRHRLAETRLGRWFGLAQEHQHELVPVKDEQGNIKYWTCTMHPSVRSKDPGTCPI